MIKLGISLRVVKAEKYDEKRDALSHDWPILLEKLGIIPVYIPNILSDLKEFLKNTDVNCLLLSGGDNIGDNPERDTSEKNIIEYGINNKIPIILLSPTWGNQSILEYIGTKILYILLKTNNLIVLAEKNYLEKLVSKKFPLHSLPKL